MPSNGRGWVDLPAIFFLTTRYLYVQYLRIILSTKCDHCSILLYEDFRGSLQKSQFCRHQSLRMDTIHQKRDMMKTVSVDLCRINQFQLMVLVCLECYHRRTCPRILTTEMIQMRLQNRMT